MEGLGCVRLERGERCGITSGSGVGKVVRSLKSEESRVLWMGKAGGREERRWRIGIGRDGSVGFDMI